MAGAQEVVSVEVGGEGRPQWSPPLRGGSTLDLSGRRWLGDARAAMEPAVERREHAGCAWPLHRVEADAAMEPAVERREHLRRGPPVARACRYCRNGARR